MVGLWEDSIRVEPRPRSRFSPTTTTRPTSPCTRYLQLAQDDEAARADREGAARRRSAAIVRRRSSNFTALAAMPARYAARARRLDSARPRCRSTRHAYPQADALTRFARGLGTGAHARRARRAGRDRRAGARCGAALREVRRHRTGRTGRSEQIARGLRVGRARRAARATKAIALMRRAADGEDGSIKHVAMENRLYPMRELLGRPAARRRDDRPTPCANTRRR